MAAVRQPSGTVTLVFTDIEGSTRLLEELGTDAYREALAAHRRIVREACARHSGYEVDYEGDAFFYAFQSAQQAVNAVSEAIAGLAEGPIRIRVGIHTGEPALDPPKYVGMDVHRAARIMAAAPTCSNQWLDHKRPSLAQRRAGAAPPSNRSAAHPRQPCTRLPASLAVPEQLHRNEPLERLAKARARAERG